MPNFTEQLLRAMADKDMSRAELSSLSGVGRPSITGYCNGTHKPGAAHKEKLAAALEVTVAYFDAEPQAAARPGRKILPADVAEALGATVQAVRVALQNRVAPYGYAVKMPGGKFVYHIPPHKFRETFGYLPSGVSIPY